MLTRRRKVPAGIRILPDGSWHVDEQPVAHAATLKHFKQRLQFDDAGAFMIDAGRRVDVEVNGPAFEVLRLEPTPDGQGMRAVLDDGSEERLGEHSLSMSHDTARFECVTRQGRARALLSRTAHNVLLDHAETADGRFFLRAGDQLIPIRT